MLLQSVSSLIYRTESVAEYATDWEMRKALAVVAFKIKYIHSMKT